MKKFIRTLWSYSIRNKQLWRNEVEKEKLLKYLNDLNFYVLHGINDSLDVHVIEDNIPIDVRLIKYIEDKMLKIKEDQEKTLEAQWCVDNQTGEKILVNVKTLEIIWRKK